MGVESRGFRSRRELLDATADLTDVATSILVVWYWIETDRRVRRRPEAIAAIGPRGVAALKEYVFHLQRASHVAVENAVNRLQVTCPKFDEFTEEEFLAMLEPACQRLRDPLSHGGLLKFATQESPAERLLIDLKAKPYATLVLTMRFRDAFERWRKAMVALCGSTKDAAAVAAAARDEGWRLWIADDEDPLGELPEERDAAGDQLGNSPVDRARSWTPPEVSGEPVGIDSNWARAQLGILPTGRASLKGKLEAELTLNRLSKLTKLLAAHRNSNVHRDFRLRHKCLGSHHVYVS
ncbi:hypothetical protein KOR34_53180 [Posidoniimonas corsicana]|uniref:Uncharacterized protein n=1 Tax=Posidoniimonas corsicana TaxID=1938618 RepID=A0A5C5UTJ5_9BACT|nr:hypothetical protein KOR34_53180 [Posidoniimonas corsicana]